ncbi:MAG: dTDP-4-dehydrorhamnose 3,5-epimerase family protein [Bryobacteraceae bacterium]|nr:dTDP-4-dehydrorhamnose 3,5-epimerase family protein [Bryobacteraceae bacterium]
MTVTEAPFAVHGDLQLALPRCEKGIGKVILKPDSPDLISGVVAAPFALWPDDRGYFLEVARIGQGPVAGFAPPTTQISAALSYPGTIKAFHYHLLQSDLWVPTMGMFQVALVDLRLGSATYGLRNTIYAGALRPWQIRIPPGVAHGYKVLGEQAGMLVYVTSQIYNPKDEGRIAYNDPNLHYDWETQHK